MPYAAYQAVLSLSTNRHRSLNQPPHHHLKRATCDPSIRKQSDTLLGFFNASQVAPPSSFQALDPEPWGGELSSNRSRGNSTQPFLFVGVLSIPESVERRRAARETWMGAASAEVAVRFVMYKVSLGSWLEV